MGVTDNFDNITGLQDVFGSVYAASGGLISLMFLVIVFVIAFISLKRYSTSVAMIGASSVTSLSGVILWGAGLLRGSFVVIPVIMLSASVLLHFITKN